ncbi:tetracycline efflux MFS transporter TetA(P) [Paenibacillus pini]
MMNDRAAKVFIGMRFIIALASSTMFTTYGIYYVTMLDLNPFQLVLVGTVLELTVLLFEGITGVVADTYGRRTSVIIAMFILGLGFVLEGSVIWLADLSSSVPSFAWLLISQVMFGIGWTFVSGADTAWIVDEVGEEHVGNLFMRSKRISLIATLLGIGISVGLSTLAPNLPYVVGGFMYLVLAFLLLFVMKETNFVPDKREAGASHLRSMANTWLSGAKVVRRSPLLLLIVVVTIFSGAASEGYERLWPTHLIHNVGFPQDGTYSMAVWFGIIAAISTILGMIAVRYTEKKVDMGSQRGVSTSMFILTVLHIAAILLLALAPSFGWALVGILLIGTVGSVSEPVYSTWLNMNLESKTRATVLSMMSQSDALGQTAGGPAVGWIGSRFSIRASLIAASVLLLPILAVFGKILRKK